MKRSTYYYHVSRQTVPDKYERAKAEIDAIYREHKGRYGYRRMQAELSRRDLILNHKTVLKLMRIQGALCKVRVKKYRSYRGSVGTVAPNLLERDFTAKAPNEKWVTDITEFHLFGERRYLSVLLDLCCHDIVSYTVSDNAKLPLTIDMLHKAIENLPDMGKKLILHSDQGWQYQHRHFQEMLAEKGIQQSMSRKGNCLDNARMESFFGILKSELLYMMKFESIDHFMNELQEYLDYYNNRRMKLQLNGLPPAIYRQQLLGTL